MSNFIRVLVTAAGGDLAQAIIKALRLSALTMQCHGSETGLSNVGSAFVDVLHLVPFASDENYVSKITDICHKNKIDFLIPASEAEIGVLSRFGSPPKLQNGTIIICQKRDWMDKYSDKFECMMNLQGRVALAAFADGHNSESVRTFLESCDFPVVVKERRSSGSKGLYIVNDKDELNSAIKSMKQPLLQEYIDNTHGEYSVCVFTSEQFTTAISFLRQLGPSGCSWYAETSHDIDVLNYCLDIAKIIGAEGSINIQVRKSRKGVRLLEINPRFSSLAAARAMGGFNDVEWSIKMAMGTLSKEDLKPIKPLKFHRYFSELVDLGYGYGRVSQWDPRPIN